MLLDFKKTASALVDSILHEQCGTAPYSPQVEPVAAFVLAQHGRLLDYLRLPLRLITLWFDGWAILRHGRPFHRLSHVQRWRQIERWKRSFLGVQRDLILFYERLAVFGFYSMKSGEPDGK